MAQMEAEAAVSQLTSLASNSQPVLSPCVEKLIGIFAKDKLDADPANVATDFIDKFCLDSADYMPGKKFPEFSS